MDLLSEMGANNLSVADLVMLSLAVALCGFQRT
jgi:hypothetical protein